MTDRPIPFSGPMVRALLDGRKTQTRRVLPVQPTDEEIRGYRIGGAVCDPKAFPGRPYVWLRGDDGSPAMPVINPPKVTPGDRLWVREAWRATDSLDHLSPSQIGEAAKAAGYRGAWCPYITEADGVVHNWGDEDRGVEMFGGFSDEPGRYRHARFMPRWASRLTHTVTDVRVQRLQEISEEDAWAEGCKRGDPWDSGKGWFPAEEPHPKGGWVGWDNAREWFADLWNTLHGPDAWDANPWVAAYTFTVQRGNIDEIGGAA